MLVVIFTTSQWLACVRMFFLTGWKLMDLAAFRGVPGRDARCLLFFVAP